MPVLFDGVGGVGVFYSGRHFIRQALRNLRLILQSCGVEVKLRNPTSFTEGGGEQKRS